VLVLTRLEGESVLLDGGRIRIMVVAVRKNGTIRLGFDVAPEVDVVREEIADDWLKNRRGPSPLEQTRSRRSPG
jgi:carbon storage regulator CsrA